MRRVKRGVARPIQWWLLILALQPLNQLHSTVFAHIENGQPVIDIPPNALKEKINREFSSLNLEGAQLLRMSLIYEDLTLIFRYDYRFNDAYGNQFRFSTAIPLYFDAISNCFTENGQQPPLTCFSVNCPDDACLPVNHECTLCNGTEENGLKPPVCTSTHQRMQNRGPYEMLLEANDAIIAWLLRVKQ